MRAVLRFVRLAEGDIAISTVERPRDNMELRFTPPLVVVPSEMTPGLPFASTSTVTATRASGRDSGSGKARAEVVMDYAAVGSDRASLESDGRIPTLTLEIDADFGVANWSRVTVIALPENGAKQARLQEQLRVLTVLVKDETRTLIATN